MKKVLLILLVFSSFQASAQLSSGDYSLISENAYYQAKDFYYYQGPDNSSDMMQTKSKGFLAKYNPISLAFRGSMWFYQNVISEQLSSPCPYEITCSNFAKKCIEQYGLIKGIALAADRIMRDNRISIKDVPQMDLNPKTHHIEDNPKRYKWHQ